MGRFFGSALLGYAALTWLAKDTTDPEAQGAIVLALLVSFLIGLIVALIGQLSGLVNQLGWSTVIIYLVFTLGYGYFQFMKPDKP